jgi:glycosyltransferase involved in cell wall biosynthesis
VSLPPDTVAIDYLPAVTHAPGVGRYARELVRAVVARDDAPPLLLLEIGAASRAIPEESLGLEGCDPARVRRIQRRIPQRALDLGHRLIGLGVDDLSGRPKIFHRARPWLPPVRKAAIVLPLAELPAPDTDAERALAIRAREAAAVVAFSEDYAQRAIQRLGVDPGRVHRTPVGAEHWVRDLGGPAGPTRRRIVVLGAMRDARRPMAVLAGFERLIASGVDAELLWVGRGDNAAREFQMGWSASAARERISWMDQPLERDMPATVGEAAVLLHLADDEGTAVTPLEACALGTAVAAERIPAFEEVLPPDTQWIDPDPGPESIADALAAALQHGVDPERRSARAKNALGHTWDACAAATIQIWRALAGAC